MEKVLSSWKPRGPSDQLRARIFEKAPPVADSRRPEPAWFAWADWLMNVPHALGTVAALLLLTLMLADGSDSWMRYGHQEGSLPLLASLSNHNWAACQGLAELKRNHPAPILGWTKDEYFPSTSVSLNELSTNYLLPKL